MNRQEQRVANLEDKRDRAAGKNGGVLVIEMEVGESEEDAIKRTNATARAAEMGKDTIIVLIRHF